MLLHSYRFYRDAVVQQVKILAQFAGLSFVPLQGDSLEFVGDGDRFSETKLLILPRHVDN